MDSRIESNENSIRRLSRVVMTLALIPPVGLIATVALGLKLPRIDHGLFWRVGLDFSWRMAGFFAAAFGTYHLVKRFHQAQWFSNLKINRDKDNPQQVEREIKLSILSCVVFAFLSIIVSLIVASGHSKIYFNVEEYGWGWFVASILLMFIAHDVYFFLTHKLLHQKWLFNRIHSIHHQSKHTSVWSTLSAHPVEAAINFSVIFIFLFFPIHFSALVFWTFFMAIINVIGHCGYETSPKWFDRHPILKYIGSASNHDAHHKFCKVNFGFYFTIWDKLAGTHMPVLIEERNVKTNQHPAIDFDCAEGNSGTNESVEVA